MGCVASLVRGNCVGSRVDFCFVNFCSGTVFVFGGSLFFCTSYALVVDSCLWFACVLCHFNKISYIFVLSFTVLTVNSGMQYLAFL